MLGEWLKAELKRAQMRQTDLARALSSRLGHRIDRATVNKMISGRRAIAADELLLMANILGVDVPTLDGPERAASKGEIDIEMETAGVAAKRPFSSAAAVPVLGARGGVRGAELVFADDDCIEWTFAAPGLDKAQGIYAAYVPGGEMMPRYRPGEMVWINPNKPVKQGDDVLVKLKDGKSRRMIGIIREFVAWEEQAVLLKMYNPAKDDRYAEEDVASIDLIVFSSRG
jgi:phage repressor protein C with HTH and peptisase S24 domain